MEWSNSSSSSFSYTGFKDGSSTSYGSGFDKSLKEEVKKFAGYRCENCGITDYESRARYGKGLHIHHLDEDKSNNCLDNLVALCSKCHTGIHKNVVVLSK